MNFKSLHTSAENKKKVKSLRSSANTNKITELGDERSSVDGTTTKYAVLDSVQILQYTAIPWEIIEFVFAQNESETEGPEDKEMVSDR